MFDDLTGEVVGRSEPVDELSHLAVDPSGQYLYGVSGVEFGQVHAWRIAGDTLVRLGAPVDSGGSEPCHLVVDPRGSCVLVANYGADGAGCVAVLPIETKPSAGSLGPATVISRHTAPGLDRDRQGQSHIHQIVFAGDDEVLVIDLGGDQVVSYRWSERRLVRPVVSPAPPGSGPRHLVLLGGGRVALSGELGSVLLGARRAGRQLGDWTVTAATGLAVAADTRNYPSDVVAIDHDLVVIANRGADSVAVLSISTGRIITEVPCGAWPGQLALAGSRLFVACTMADQVSVLDAHTLQPLCPPLTVGRPTCVVLTPPT